MEVAAGAATGEITLTCGLSTFASGACNNGLNAGRQDAVLKDEQLRGFRFAQVPKEPVDLHRAFVEEAARVVGPRRVRFDLVFYVALKDIREYCSFV